MFFAHVWIMHKLVEQLFFIGKNIASNNLPNFVWVQNSLFSQRYSLKNIVTLFYINRLAKLCLLIDFCSDLFCRSLCWYGTGWWYHHPLQWSSGAALTSIYLFDYKCCIESVQRLEIVSLRFWK